MMRSLPMTAWTVMALLAALPLLAQKQQMTPLDQARRVQSAAGDKQAAPAPAQKRSGSSPAAAPAAPQADSGKGAKPGERRDPFVSVIKPAQPGQSSEPTNCGPGTRGIVVGQTELNGVVRAPSGVLAVVTTRNNNRTYFLKEGTTLCNGRVAKITSDSMTIDEEVIDAMGKPAKREVIRKIPAEAK